MSPRTGLTGCVATSMALTPPKIAERDVHVLQQQRDAQECRRQRGNGDQDEEQGDNTGGRHGSPCASEQLVERHPVGGHPGTDRFDGSAGMNDVVELIGLRNDGPGGGQDGVGLPTDLRDGQQKVSEHQQDTGMVRRPTRGCRSTTGP